MNPPASDWAEHHAALDSAPDPEPLDPSDALGHDENR